MAELFQFANDPVDSGPSRAVVGPSIGQAHANNQLPHRQRTMKPGQSFPVDYSSQSPQWQPPSAGIEDGDPYYGKSDYPQEPDQQRNRYQDSPSSFQDDNWSAQSESGHTWGSPESQDYYSQDDDWRAEPQPGDYEGEVPDSQYSDLHRSSSSKEEFSDWDTYLRRSQQLSRYQEVPIHSAILQCSR
jgi:hypothetical protein